MSRPLVVILMILSCWVPRCWGWTAKEHALLTRLAAEHLLADPATPPAMKVWLSAAAPGLRDLEGEKKFALEARLGTHPRGVDGIIYWSIAPDLFAAVDGYGDNARPIAPFGVSEHMLHVVEVEYFFPDDSRRSYVDDLSHKPALKDFPRDKTDPRWKRSGMLPFRVEQCYKSMVNDLAAGRMFDRPGQYPRDEHAQRWAGMLAHYAEDNFQPHHSTADFRSQSYFKMLLAGPNVHSDMESRLLDDELDDYMPLRLQFWDAFANALSDGRDPAESKDPWTATLEISLQSYDALPMIGHAAQAAYTRNGDEWKFNADAFFHYQAEYQGKKTTILRMKALLMASAVRHVERLWLQAWNEAHDQPAK